MKSGQSAAVTSHHRTDNKRQFAYLQICNLALSFCICYYKCSFLFLSFLKLTGNNWKWKNNCQIWLDFPLIRIPERGLSNLFS